MLPRVSIIVPCYNAGKLLPSCIDGIVAQEYVDKELVLVDGGSSDDTVSILRSYAERYPFIRWISEKDKGVYDAMNKGVGFATGEWIYFLGADDALYHNRILEEVFGSAIADKCDVLYGNAEFLYSKEIYGGPFDLKRVLFVSNICHQAMFYRRRVFEAVGSYDILCKIYSDRDFNIRCLLNKQIRFAFIDKLICVYNEMDGVSAKNDDPVFREKQAMYIKDYNKRPLVASGLFIQQLRSRLKRLIKPAQN